LTGFYPRAALAVCPSVYQSHADIVLIVLNIGFSTYKKDFFTYPTLCYKEIRVCTKIREHFSGTLSPTQISPLRVHRRRVSWLVSKRVFTNVT